jgi:hypothetical protein
MCSPASTSRCARVTSAQRVFPAFADALGMTEAEFEAKLRSDYPALAYASKHDRGKVRPNFPGATGRQNRLRGGGEHVGPRLGVPVHGANPPDLPIRRR